MHFLQIRMFDVFCDTYGEEKTIELCMAQNMRAPLTVRVNPLKASREDLINKWRDANKFAIKPTEYSPLGITFTSDKNV
jgi:16S rRNA (cytosine967-C5)-methyltransferase